MLSPFKPTFFSHFLLAAATMFKDAVHELRSSDTPVIARRAAADIVASDTNRPLPPSRSTLLTKLSNTFTKVGAQGGLQYNAFVKPSSQKKSGPNEATIYALLEDEPSISIFFPGSKTQNFTLNGLSLRCVSISARESKTTTERTGEEGEIRAPKTDQKAVDCTVLLLPIYRGLTGRLSGGKPEAVSFLAPGSGDLYEAEFVQFTPGESFEEVVSVKVLLDPRGMSKEVDGLGPIIALDRILVDVNL